MNPPAHRGGGGVVAGLPGAADGALVKAAVGITKISYATGLLYQGFERQPGLGNLLPLLAQLEAAEVRVGQGVRANFLPSIDPGLHLRRCHQRHLGHTTFKVPLVALANPSRDHITGGTKPKTLQHRQRTAQVVFITVVKGDPDNPPRLLPIQVGQQVSHGQAFQAHRPQGGHMPAKGSRRHHQPTHGSAPGRGCINLVVHQNGNRGRQLHCCAC